MATDRSDALLKEYSEVNSTFRTLTDIRFKLLAFLPVAAAAAAAVVTQVNVGVETLALALFGLVVTIGLVTYNIRNDQLYDTLVGRGAAIERQLGLPDGLFANRPRPWLDIEHGLLRWRFEHGYGTYAIYCASIGLWLFGAFASLGELARHGYVLLGLGPIFSTDTSAWIDFAALVAATAVTVAAAYGLRRRRANVSARLRSVAKSAVDAACGRSAGALADDSDFLAFAAELAGGQDKRDTIRARLKFLGGLDAAAAALYVSPTAAKEVAAAQLVATIADMPPEWLYDSLTDRRQQTVAASTP